MQNEFTSHDYRQGSGFPPRGPLSIEYTTKRDVTRKRDRRRTSAGEEGLPFRPAQRGHDRVRVVVLQDRHTGHAVVCPTSTVTVALT